MKSCSHKRITQHKRLITKISFKHFPLTLTNIQEPLWRNPVKD